MLPSRPQCDQILFVVDKLLFLVDQRLLVVDVVLYTVIISISGSIERHEGLCGVQYSSLKMC